MFGRLMQHFFLLFTILWCNRDVLSLAPLPTKVFKNTNETFQMKYCMTLYLMGHKNFQKSNSKVLKSLLLLSQALFKIWTEHLRWFFTIHKPENITEISGFLQLRVVWIFTKFKGCKSKQLVSAMPIWNFRCFRQ